MGALDSEGSLPPKFHDAWFLIHHPGWSYRDYLNAPDELVTQMELLISCKAEYDKERSNQ